MVQLERVNVIHTVSATGGEYVLYWMQAAQRSEYNHALEYAIEQANKLGKPLIVLFCLVSDYPDANERHYRFMLEGLVEVQGALEAKGIRMVILKEPPQSGVTRIARRAALIVMDAGHLRIQRKWRREVTQLVGCPLVEVETNLIVPVEAASDKEDYSAGIFRRKIDRQLNRFLIGVRHKRPKVNSLKLSFDSLSIKNIDRVVSELDIDHCVSKTGCLTGGLSRAKKRLREFLSDKLDLYPEKHGDPNCDCSSNMSPYLHFGQISPLFIALEVLKTSSPGKDTYLEQLIVRRELSHNFIRYNPDYDTFQSLPAWAVRTLNCHRRDKRRYVYSLDRLESAKTHDVYWNAAQNEMVLTGKMHNYMRMYWGKKIIEWTGTPQTAFKIALYLNNKYELDGRDPNGFAGVAWCFGKHDRPWPERSIFGQVRYMNADGLKRKFDADTYVKKIEKLRKAQEESAV